MPKTRLSTFCDRFIEAGWLAADIVAPLFFNAYSRRVFEPDKLSTIRSIALAMALAWLVKVGEEGFGKPTEGESSPIRRFLAWATGTPLIVPTLVIVLVYILSTLFSVARPASIWGSYQRLQGTYTTFSYIVVFLLAVETIKTWAQVERLVTVVILTSFPISFFGVLQRFRLDPLMWQGDVTVRVTSTMGNPIFISAYLIMAIPLTIAQWLRALLALGRGEKKVANFLLAVSFTFVLLMQLLCFFFAQSRGPLLGLLGGLFLFGVLLGLWLGAKKFSWAVLALGAAGAMFLLVFNLSNTPLEPLRELPYIGRLGKVFEVSEGTGRVRVLIWEGASQMVRASPLRSLIGYGPESMFVAYNPYYPPDLAHYENRFASPDRSHNETFDALVITGMLGLAAYLFIFGSAFYLAFQSLGLASRPRDLETFLGLWVGGALLGFLVPRLVLGNLVFSGVGLAAGAVLGVVGYLVWRTIGFRGRITLGERKALLLISLFAAMLAHFIEINFGIAIASTRTHFWLFAALLVVAGFRLKEMSAAQEVAKAETAVHPEPAPRSRRKRRAQARKATLPPKATPWTWLCPALSLSLPMVLVFITLGYLFVTPAFSLQGGYKSMVFLMALSWMVGGGVLAGVLSEREGLKAKELGYALIIYSGLVWAALGFFASINLKNLRTPGADNIWTISRYYLGLFVVMLALGGVLPRQGASWGDLPWVAKARWGWPVYPLLAAGTSLLIVAANLAVVQADTAYNEGLSYFNAGVGYSQNSSFDREQLDRIWDRAIELYHKAQKLAPREDFYYFEETRALQYKYRSTLPQAQWGPMVEEAIAVTLRAHQLNPLNTDHVLNLGRLQVDWANAASSTDERKARLEEAISYYQQALAMSPNAAHIYNELAGAYAALGDLTQAMAMFQHSLALDDRYIDTYMAQFRILMQVGNLAESQAVLDRAVAADPKSIEVRSARAYLYVQMGMLAEAIAENLEVLKLDPRNFASQQNLIILYERAGRLDEAIAQAQAAIPQAPAGELPALQSALGNLYLRKGDLTQAEAYYRRALSLNKDFAQAHKGLGLTYANQGKLLEAITETQTALKLIPNDYESLKNLALMHQDLGQPGEALTYARKALELAPTEQKPALETLIAQLEGK